jgi:uncharacterized protein YndB with AHSA1/START domain
MPTMPTHISLDTIIPAAISAVYQSWIDPRRMTWFGSDPNGRVIHAAADPQPGGRFTVTFRNFDETEFTFFGLYDEVQLNRKLSFSWEWANEPGNISYVTVDLTPAAENQTHMLFTHSGLWEGSAHNYLEGWQSTFDKLARLLAE